MNRKDLYRRADKLWGPKAQLAMLMEECMELALAIRKFQRNPESTAYANLCDEFADVRIMMEQIMMTDLKKDSEERVEFKLNRLKDRIENVEKSIWNQQGKQQEIESLTSGEQSSK